MTRRRDRIRGRTLRLGPALEAEVRRSCLNELRLVYRGPCFDEGVWRALAPLGTYECFEASKLSPRLRDLCRIRGPGLLLEGARDGDVLIATYAPPGKLAARRRVEATLKTLAQVA